MVWSDKGMSGESAVVRFWEARVGEGQLDAAVTWVHRNVVQPSLSRGAVSAEMFVADEDRASGNPARVVVLSRWSGVSDPHEPEPDGVCVVRAHGWDFRTTEGS
ncbi:MAG TPA: hypothetical protein DHW34_02990 [Actinobacteria bacterium]|nr:hypothetical protein [Actinomycetota bacterium]